MSCMFKADGSRAAKWHKRALFAIAFILPAMLALSGCETMQVGTSHDRNATFSNFKTFTWLPRQNYGVTNPLVVERAREYIERELEAKGYDYVNDLNDADFSVDFTIGARERVDLETYPVPYAGPWAWYGRRWWGYPYWGVGVDVNRYREGVLAIDVFDGRTHKPIWHGWVKQPLSSEDVNPGKAIRKAVNAVLGDFPPSAL